MDTEQEELDALKKAFEQFVEVMEDVFDEVKRFVEIVFNFIRAVWIAFFYPQRTDPLSHAKIRRLISHLPNTLSVLR